VVWIRAGRIERPGAKQQVFSEWRAGKQRFQADEEAKAVRRRAII